MSKYTVRIASDIELKHWDNFVFSNKGLVFHKITWLRIMEKHSNARLFPILVYKGEKLRCILPVFLKKIHGLKYVFSPPPKLGIPELGPIIYQGFINNYKNEIERIKILDYLNKYLLENIKYDIIKINLTISNQDIRPFLWLKYKSMPTYSYYLNLGENPDNIFNCFDGSIRTSIRKVEKYTISYYENRDHDYKEIIKLVRKRYNVQNLKYPISDEYLDDIYSKYKNSLFTISAVDSENNLISGLIIIEKDKDIASHWIGGIATSNKYSGINENLHWKAINYFFKKGFKYYEFMGGNTKRLVQHKSKFNSELIPNFSLIKSNFKGKIGLFIYDIFKRKK